ncbi:hypothetical protein LLR08_22420 [Rouxiella badensis]|uniref:hypothetical protein n=1 Tax=Rouxiella badensis TaxID=1646377 RepID=UPI001D132FB3|nr:hypothetical protein [Rouxiella badensis]MCC3705296.1 hypothetical protein [Rouxiella badensis]
MAKGNDFSLLTIKTKIILLMLSLLSASAMAEEPPVVLTGTIGRSAVVMELDLNKPEAITGRYFYEKYHLDLPLNGTEEDGELSLQEGTDDFNDTPRPTLRLQSDGKSGWQGTWSNPQGKIMPIELTPAQLPETNADPFLTKLIHDSPYEYLRLSNLQLEKGKEQTFMDYPLQWWHEPQSGVSLFTLASGYPEAQLKEINQRLMARLWQEVIDYHSCMLGASQFGSGEFEQSVTPELLSSTVVSVKISTSYSCGGAHPDFGDSPLNLNAKTGAPLSLEDIMWIGKEKPFHYMYAEDHDERGNNGVSFDDYSTYREKNFAPWLISQFKQLYPSEMQKPKGNDDCDYSDAEIWYYPSWYLTPKGIHFGPSFARAMRDCEGTSWSVLPWAVRTQHQGGVPLTLPQ